MKAFKNFITGVLNLNNNNNETKTGIATETIDNSHNDNSFNVNSSLDVNVVCTASKVNEASKNDSTNQHIDTDTVNDLYNVLEENIYNLEANVTNEIINLNNKDTDVIETDDINSSLISEDITESGNSQDCINLDDFENFIDNCLLPDDESLNINSDINMSDKEVINVEFNEIFDIIGEADGCDRANIENEDYSHNRLDVIDITSELDGNNNDINLTNANALTSNNDTLITNNETPIASNETNVIENKNNENKISDDSVVFIKEFESLSFTTLKAVIPVVISSRCSDKHKKNSEPQNQNNVKNSNTINDTQSITKILRNFRKVKKPNDRKTDLTNTERDKPGYEGNCSTNPEEDNTEHKKSYDYLKAEEQDNKSVITISSTEDNDPLSTFIEETDADCNKAFKNSADENCDSKTSIKNEEIVSFAQETDDGYNSSDFEFISQSDAETDGFIINYMNRELKPEKKNTKVQAQAYTQEISRVRHDSGSSQESQEHQESHEIYVPVAGPSHRPDNYYRDHYVHVQDYRNLANENRRNHVVPEGVNYMNLFQGIHDPVLADLMMIENKSLPTATSMTAKYGGIGFDMRLQRNIMEESEDEEYKEEAAETAKKILSMYPGENRKRRRRFL